METAIRRQSATIRVWGSIGSAEIFAEGTAHTTTKRRWTGQIQAGLGVHVGEWGVERAAAGQRCFPRGMGLSPYKGK
jgi:hypothetical protein